MAFTEEQRELLAAAFDHVWARMSSLHNLIKDEAQRIDALGLILAEQGLITAEQWEAAIAQLELRAGVEAHNTQRASPPGRLSEEEITRQILNGDVEAFERRHREEDTE